MVILEAFTLENRVYDLYTKTKNQGTPKLWYNAPGRPFRKSSKATVPNSRELRRFFLVDGVSGREENLTNVPASVTLAAELLLSISLPINHPRDNSPFRLMVKYAGQSNSGITQVLFSVSYLYDPGTAQEATNIAFGVLGFLALLYALLETSGWAHRSQLPNVNFMLVVQFMAYLAGSLANVFFMVTLEIGIYWLIIFKGQQVSAVEVMLPAAGGQIETSFIIYVLCAFVLKTLDIVHILISQVRVSIFMIDWERLKKKQTLKGYAGDQEAASCVSAWRTFWIANEWNEIQTRRKVHPSFQLFAVLLLLEVKERLRRRNICCGPVPG